MQRIGLMTSPGNENEVGLGIKDNGVPREEIFLTSKLWNTHQPNVKEGLQKTLDALEVDYLDLYESRRCAVVVADVQHFHKAWTQSMMMRLTRVHGLTSSGNSGRATAVQCHVQIVSEETGLNSVFPQPQLPQETLVPLGPSNMSSMPKMRSSKTIRTLRLLTLPGARSPSIKGIKGNK
ncbi:hypothetical protein FJTKL_05096 [Diaporthe vaccinii]|uniref:Uncharacterized protein n=1 Tax=Diaporthe vaccinii TaxID=105482 RepID=A0ABR4EZD1_9PEZI